jgi:hypothetical protein
MVLLGLKTARRVDICLKNQQKRPKVGLKNIILDQSSRFRSFFGPKQSFTNITSEFLARFYTFISIIF